MFSIQEFLVFAGYSEAKRPTYSIIASGVISTVESIYGLKLSVDTFDYNAYTTDGKTYTFGITPITSINSVTYNGSAVDYTYDYTSQTITLTTSVQDLSIPIIINLTAGYTNIPSNLKLAIYTHISDVIFRLENHTSSITRSSNSTGNTITFSQDSIPYSSSVVYDFYSKRQVIA